MKDQRLSNRQIATLKHLAICCGNGGQVTLTRDQREAMQPLWRRGAAIALAESVSAADPRGWTMTRAAVLARDNYTCIYCGSVDDIACDHVHPRSRGGLDIMENLVAACKPCNSSKGDKLLSEWHR